MLYPHSIGVNKEGHLFVFLPSEYNNTIGSVSPNRFHFVLLQFSAISQGFLSACSNQPQINLLKGASL